MAPASTTTRPGKRRGPCCWRPPTTWRWLRPRRSGRRRKNSSGPTSSYSTSAAIGTTNGRRISIAFLARGGGLVYIHWALDGRDHGQEFAKRIGLAKASDIAFRHGPLALVFNRKTNHPIIRNFDRLNLVDESYWKLSGPLPASRVLGTSDEDGQPQPQLWTTEPGNGRVFVSHPRPLLVDVRRPAVPRAAAARHRLGRPRTGRSVQRTRVVGRRSVIAAQNRLAQTFSSLS